MVAYDDDVLRTPMSELRFVKLLEPHSLYRVSLDRRAMDPWVFDNA